MNLRNVAKHALSHNWKMASVESLPTPLFRAVYPHRLEREGSLWRFEDGGSPNYLPRAVDALRLTHIGTEPRQRVYHKYVGRSPWDPSEINTVVDVGAFIGELHMGGGFAGIAVEPDTNNYACCSNNLEDLDVKVVKAAAWYEDRLIDFAEDRDGSESRIYGDRAHRLAQSTVQARPLSQLVKLAGYDRRDIDLVKIDAEGYEPEVLAGAVPHYTRFAVDVSAERHGESTERLCRALLASHGYTAERRGDVLYAD